MNNKFVYLLWNHGEYGPEDLFATLNHLQLYKILPELVAKDDIDYVADELSKIFGSIEPIEHFAKNYGGHNLQVGWGGLHLSIVPLDTFKRAV